ncbi:TetR family transcriptional regulator [Actinoplanes cyaneus]|jgi:AcrR family transcriptional regulator|uniref:TetR family transcriptional regulator n=1 Tax=Actinoplanes cyaneus TaxID=52696 RepID=A0A919M6Q9_9ACTN|nr:TetR/AcrR family transcriptional regulator [Actinoplanes cyaneus]MCW2138135.1 transcriptional regulator, TetR family [Actinoplanes cyaneus]GID64654.1 TetR family transcriptional regulator [Actinoplanes cyaneus]
MAGQRADARRNYELLLAVASRAIAEQGADASLEQIARTAGVGSGTVRRHFPTRHALLAAVFQDRTELLAGRARELAGRPDSRAALLEWLDAVLSFATTSRGLAEALHRDHVADPADVHEHCATARLTEAGRPLVDRAAAEGALAPDVTVTDLLSLVTGIALTTEHHPDAAAEASRLLGLTIAGISPGRP